MGIRGIDISWILLEDPSRMTLGGFFLLFGGTRSGGRFGKKNKKKRQSFGEENIGGGVNKRKKGLGLSFWTGVATLEQSK